MCLLGYCLFPIDVAALVAVFVHISLVRCVHSVLLEYCSLIIIILPPPFITLHADVITHFTLRSALVESIVIVCACSFE